MLTFAKAKFDVEKIRGDFPILGTHIDGKPLVYLDNGATTQKPLQVIDFIAEYYRHENSTVKRGVYGLSERSTELFEQARKTVAQFINAKSSQEIIFTKGCTEAINLVAKTFSSRFLKEGDEIILTAMEHHANIVPWQLASQEHKFKIKVLPINQNGELILEELPNLINEKTKLISVMHISNVLGTINPIKQICEIAKKYNIAVLVDGAQAAPHTPIDVQDLGCDFYAFSGHKLYGPTGVGVIYGRYEMLESLPPYQGGGDMIDLVSFERTTFAKPPTRFEAGTPPIAQVLGLAEAVKYLQNIGITNIQNYEEELLTYATKRLSEIEGLKIIGNAEHKASLISFTIDGIHPHDMGTLLDQFSNIAIRVGHHCAQPLMAFYGLPSTARASFAFYNTFREIDILVDSLRQVQDMFK
jgi:cysteine desulfurase/selenocysteine lyase